MDTVKEIVNSAYLQGLNHAIMTFNLGLELGRTHEECFSALVSAYAKTREELNATTKL